MSNKEETIIKALRLMSKHSSGSQKFKAGLLNEIENKLTSNNKNYYFLSLFDMKKYALPFFTVGIFFLAIGGYAIFMNGNNPFKDKYNYDIAQTTEAPENNDLTSGLRLATDFHKTIDEAQKATSFPIKRATTRLNSEVLYTIETSTDFPDSDPNMDSYFLSYNENGKIVYKVSGMGIEREVIEGVEVLINGKKAYYYVVPESELSMGDNIAAGEYGPSAKSFIYWNENGHSYEVSEYNGMSKDDLIKLAESVK